MVAAVSIYLAFNAGQSSAHGWGIARSTDTAFALGCMALNRGRPFRTVCERSCLPLWSSRRRCRCRHWTVYNETVSVVPLIWLPPSSCRLVGAQKSLRGGTHYLVLGGRLHVRHAQVGGWSRSRRLVWAPCLRLPAPRSNLERANRAVFREFRETTHCGI